MENGKLNKIELYSTDYVVLDEANDTLVKFGNNGDIIIFGNKEEAENNCYGNEIVVRCTDLSKHHKNNLIKQIHRLKN